jgi:hypothetical protein
MYSKSSEHWDQIVGGEGNSNGIFSIIFSKRSNKGGLPRGTTFPHFNKESEAEKLM